MEYLDTVNEEDEVIGKEERRSAKYTERRHRIVHVFLFDHDGRMALQLRAASVSYMPNAWCTSACGHVSAGEDYDTAAKRELIEEAGIEVPLQHFAKDLYDETHMAMLASYKGEADGPFFPGTPDVAKIEFFNLEQIKDMIKREKFHPETLFLLKKYFLK